MFPTMDQERLLRQSSAPCGGCRSLGSMELGRSHSVHEVYTPPMSPSTGVRGLSVNELKQRTAQRIAQTAIKHQPLRVDQRQQQQEYLTANQNGMGEQLRRQYVAAGHFQAARGSLSSEPRRFQSAPGSLSEPSTPQQVPQSAQQQHQRVCIPHGLTVHELKAMTRARLAHCALVSNSNQVTTHEKAATSSACHSAASIFPQETRTRSGSLHLYAPRANHPQHNMEKFQVHGQQQLREVSRLVQPKGPTSESATRYLCTTPSGQSANSSPNREEDCNIRMQTISNQPHGMHQQVVPQHTNPSYTCAMNSSVASRISSLPDNVNMFMSSSIELAKPSIDRKDSFSLGDSPLNKSSMSSAALASHPAPSSYWEGCLQYDPPFGSSPTKVPSDPASLPWESQSPATQDLAHQNHRRLPSHSHEGDVLLCMAQSVAEFALLTPHTRDHVEKITPPENGFTKLSELAADSSGATQSLSENELEVLEQACHVAVNPFESCFANGH